MLKTTTWATLQQLLLSSLSLREERIGLISVSSLLGVLVPLPLMMGAGAMVVKMVMM
jgi:hypothetical protein